MIRRLSVLFALVLACPTTVYGATNSLHKGAWGLEFQVQPSIFGSSGTAGIAMRKLYSNRSAVRLGFMASVGSSDIDGSDQVDRAFPWDTVQVASSVVNYSDHREASAFLHLMKYLEFGTRFGMTLEAGPTVRWTSDEYGRTEVYPAPRGTYINADDSDIWYYGGEVMAGFEWFFRSRLSLSGRYGITALRNEGHQTFRFDFTNPNDGAWDRRYSDRRVDGFVVQTMPAAISLTGYF